MSGTSLDGLDISLIKSDGKKKITTSGHEYWGDYILLQVLMNILKCINNIIQF